MKFFIQWTDGVDTNGGLTIEAENSHKALIDAKMRIPPTASFTDIKELK